MDVVLVTGGAGYVGSHAVLALRAGGWPVIVADDLSVGRRALVPADVPLHVGDVGVASFIAPLLAKHRPRAVMHFAANVSVPESVADPLKYYRNNFTATCVLVQACLATGVEAFLLSSSAAVYGAPTEQPIREDVAAQPVNPYGRSKLLCEQMLAEVSGTTGLRYAALRYFNVAGADAEGRAGPLGHNSTNLIKSLAELATGKRESVTIFGEDYPTKDGTCVRDFVHPSDLADAHLRGLEYLMQGGTNVVLNCGYSHGYSVREVVTMAQEIAGPLKVRAGPRRAGDPPALIADTARIRETLRWLPRHDDLREMLHSAIAWERALSS